MNSPESNELKLKRPKGTGTGTPQNRGLRPDELVEIVEEGVTRVIRKGERWKETW